MKEEGKRKEWYECVYLRGREADRGSAKCVAQRVANFTFAFAATFIQGHGADGTTPDING